MKAETFGRRPLSSIQHSAFSRRPSPPSTGERRLRLHPHRLPLLAHHGHQLAHLGARPRRLGGQEVGHPLLQLIRRRQPPPPCMAPPSRSLNDFSRNRSATAIAYRLRCDSVIRLKSSVPMNRMASLTSTFDTSGTFGYRAHQTAPQTAAPTSRRASTATA